MSRLKEKKDNEDNEDNKDKEYNKDNKDNKDNEDNEDNEDKKRRTKKRVQYCDDRAVSHSCDVFYGSCQYLLYDTLHLICEMMKMTEIH